ncbi:MAG: YraN family protein [Roseobacter sp.]
MYHSDPNKLHAGEMAYHGGLSAEESVARHYCQNTYALHAQRWRGASGELDLVFASGDDFVFVEVKKAACFDIAVQRISRRQQQRILSAATEFVATQPYGQLSNMRFDVALVDSVGAIRILENALFDG